MDSLQIKEGAWQERGNGVFEGELIPQCTLRTAKWDFNKDYFNKFED